jgi:hypothetical protein
VGKTKRAVVLRVCHNNEAGPLDTIDVSAPDENEAAMLAMRVAAKMLKTTGGLYPGDSITVTEVARG